MTAWNDLAFTFSDFQDLFKDLRGVNRTYIVTLEHQRSSTLLFR
jgi:hypothetical protein